MKCRVGVSVKTSLKTHMRTHTGAQLYTCIDQKEAILLQRVGPGFSLRSRLKQHMLTDDEEKSFTCQDCGAGMYVLIS